MRRYLSILMLVLSITLIDKTMLRPFIWGTPRCRVVLDYGTHIWRGNMYGDFCRLPVGTVWQ